MCDRFVDARALLRSTDGHRVRVAGHVVGNALTFLDEHIQYSERPNPNFTEPNRTEPNSSVSVIPNTRTEPEHVRNTYFEG